MEEQKEQNYWPGFVDALSNVVLVLIFVLVVFIFALVFSSDKLRKRAENLSNRLEEITQEKAVEADPDRNLAKENKVLQSKLDAALARLLEAQEEIQRLQEEIQNLQEKIKELQEQILKLKEDMPKPSDKSLEELEAENKELQKQLDALLKKLAALEVDKTEIKEIMDNPDHETIQVVAQDLSNIEDDVLQKQDKGSIVLVFPRNVFKLDDSAKDSLDKAFEKYKSLLKNSKTSITSVTGAETYSEGRRLAYFRGLSVRNYLIENKYAKGREVHVVIQENKEVKDGRVEIRFLRK